MADTSILTNSTVDSALNITENANTGATANHGKRKKTRHRNRKLYSDILRQMEFYFSDANLHKDKYLKSNMQQPDGWIEIELFSEFKKIKAITSDRRVLIRALSKSDKLELSSDGKRVRRKTPYVPPNAEDVDKRTVYLEPVPIEADHNFVQNLIKHKSPSKILYVSLPRFKRSGQLKGFAFIEFETAEAAAKCCELYPPLPCHQQQQSLALLSSTPVSSEVSIKFPQSNKQLESLKRREEAKSEDHPDNHPEAQQALSEDSNPLPTPAATSNTEASISHNILAKTLAPNSHPAPQRSFWVISKARWSELKQKYLALQKERIEALKLIVAGKNPSYKKDAAALRLADGNKVAKEERHQGPKKRKNSEQLSAKSSGDSEISGGTKPKHIKFDDD